MRQEKFVFHSLVKVSAEEIDKSNHQADKNVMSAGHSQELRMIIQSAEPIDA